MVKFDRNPGEWKEVEAEAGLVLSRDGKSFLTDRYPTESISMVYTKPDFYGIVTDLVFNFENRLNLVRVWFLGQPNQNLQGKWNSKGITIT